MFPFRADWLEMRFLHYWVAPVALQPFVPLPLDLCEGYAWVSLVAFEQARFRPAGTWALGAALMGPLASHLFLNVRTYVKSAGGERAIYFLAEWVNLKLAAWMGPRVYGLPYRLADIHYRLETDQNCRQHRIASEEGELEFRTRQDVSQPDKGCVIGSLDEFLLERYLAFTAAGKSLRQFRVRHAPWKIRPAAVEFARDDLLQKSFPWYGAAKFHGGHSSAGAFGVGLGPPRNARNELIHHLRSNPQLIKA